MTPEKLKELMVSNMEAWYLEEVARDAGSGKRYVVCAGLAVLERMRGGHFPLSDGDYITSKNQVRTSGPLIEKILARYGETRPYLREGGRTTRGTRTAADGFVGRLNALKPEDEIEGADLEDAIDEMQRRLCAKATEDLNEEHMRIDIDVDKPVSQIIDDIITAAGTKAGAVAQHLVGAKLAIKFPDLSIENYSYTTADQQLSRAGDFRVNDTIFHVTVAPTLALFQKCAENLRNGFRVTALTTAKRIALADSLADQLGIANRVAVKSLEGFIGQNIEELARFAKPEVGRELRDLLEKYNERVESVETNHSFMIDVPDNLGRR